MLKLAELSETQYSDESGRKILIATGPRIFFRKNLNADGNDFSDSRNQELNQIIGEDVSQSSTIKTFSIGSSDVATKSQEIGVIKKSSRFGIYYICVASTNLRVISIQTSIKEGSPQKNFPSKIETGINDSGHNMPIVVNTTVRMAFREMYKDTPFPPDTAYTFANAKIDELSKYIAEVYSQKSNQVMHIWNLKDKPGQLGEIRVLGRNRYFMSIIADNKIYITSIQTKWYSKGITRSLKLRGGGGKSDFRYRKVDWKDK